MQISSPQYGPLIFNPVNIQTGLKLDTTSLSCQKDFGTIVIQQYKTAQYSIRYILLNFLKPVVLHFKEENTAIRNRLVLKGNFQIQKDRGKKTFIKQGQLLLLGENDDEQTIYFGHQSEYRLFDTIYSDIFLLPLVEAFPSLLEIINDSSHHRKIKAKQPRFAVPDISRIAQNLLKCPYDGALRKVYFEIKMKDYLFEALAPAFEKEIFGKKAMEEQRVYQASQIILSDLTKHISLREISRQVGLNENKLKTAFKDILGTPVFKHLVQARMEQARHLLLTTDKPIKEIASLTGFKYLTNFATAFRKYYGDTPGELRADRP